METEIRKLEEHLLPTDFEREEKFEYILSPDEEEKAIEWELQRFVEGRMYKIGRMNLTAEEKNKALSMVSIDNYLTHERIAEILFRANSNKQSSLWHKHNDEERLKKAADEAKETIETWTPKFMLNFMKWRSEEKYKTKLIINQQSKQIIIPLVYFLTNDPRFESELGFSLSKGLLFRGVSGLGKTYMVELAAGNLLNPILVQSMIDITEELKSSGEYKFVLGDKTKIYLDDVGTEQTPVKYFGTDLHWFKDFIESYYYRKLPHSNLIISTNLNWSEMRAKYTYRVERRMKEMFNVVDLNGLPFIN